MRGECIRPAPFLYGQILLRRSAAISGPSVALRALRDLTYTKYACIAQNTPCNGNPRFCLAARRTRLCLSLGWEIRDIGVRFAALMYTKYICSAKAFICEKIARSRSDVLRIRLCLVFSFE